MSDITKAAPSAVRAVPFMTLRLISSGDRTTWSRLWYGYAPSMPTRSDENDAAHREKVCAHIAEWDPTNNWNALVDPRSPRHGLIATDIRGEAIGFIHLNEKSGGIFSFEEILVDPSLDSFDLRMAMKKQVEIYGRDQGWVAIIWDKKSEYAGKNYAAPTPANSEPKRPTLNSTGKAKAVAATA